MAGKRREVAAMASRRGVTKLGLAGLALGLAVLAGPPSAEAQQRVTLRMVGAWAPGVSPYADVGHKFKDLVGELSKGRLTIRYVGAEDVVPVFDQPEALVNGVFDVWYGAPNYWAGVIPGGYVTELSSFEVPDQGPGSALFDFMGEMYKRRGVRYLGHYTGVPGIGSHFLHAQKEIKAVADLKGLKVRVPPLTRYFVQGVGAESVTLPPSEIFLAMDRGTVQGFTWPVADGFANYGWQNVTKFMIDHPMYRSGTGIAMNLKKWDALPPDLQAVVMDAVKQTQAWTRDWFAEQQGKQIDKMKAGGMRILSISDEEKRRWTEAAQESLWKYLQTVMTPDDFSKAETLLERKR